MAAVSITLAEAKRHLRMDPAAGADDPDVQQKLDVAEAMVFGYVARTDAGRITVASWADATSTPTDVRGLVLLQLAELWRFRGDDLAGPQRDSGGSLAPLVRNALRRHTPVVVA